MLALGRTLADGDGVGDHKTAQAWIGEFSNALENSPPGAPEFSNALENSAPGATGDGDE